MKKQINPTIKAYLIRSAFYILLLLGVCAIPFALAQRQATKRAVAQSTFQKPDSAANLPEAAPPATGSDFRQGVAEHFSNRAVAASDDFKCRRSCIRNHSHPSTGEQMKRRSPQALLGSLTHS
jgi:hypothetical protein